MDFSGPITVLLVERNENDIVLFQRALLRIGQSRVHVSKSCQQALDYIQGNNVFEDRVTFPFPDALILQVEPRHTEGFKLLSWLKRHPECCIIPVIVFSESTDPDNIKRAYQLGANTYFTKSPDLARLEVQLRAIWQYWRAATRPPSPPDFKCKMRPS
jgi:CheY-like chemotaxis protein